MTEVSERGRGWGVWKEWGWGVWHAWVGVDGRHGLRCMAGMGWGVWQASTLPSELRPPPSTMKKGKLQS